MENGERRGRGPLGLRTPALLAEIGDSGEGQGGFVVGSENPEEFEGQLRAALKLRGNFKLSTFNRTGAIGLLKVVDGPDPDKVDVSELLKVGHLPKGGV